MARQAYSQEQVDGKREEILDAAMRLFETDGIGAVSFRKLAAELGCSYVAPYRYFQNKADLVAGLRERTYRWMGEAMSAAMRPEASALNQLHDLALAYVETALARPSRYALLFDLSQPGTPTAEMAAAREQAFSICTRVVSTAEAKGELQLNFDPLTVAHLFWAGMHGIVALNLAGQFVMGRSVEQLVQPLIRTLIKGVQSTPRAAT